MQFITFIIPFLITGAMGAPTGDTSPSEISISECRAKAQSSADECACFPGCVLIPHESGPGFEIDMTNSTFLNKRQGCGNPRAFVVPSGTIINFGTAKPFDVYSKLFDSCQQHGCDPNPRAVGTTILEGSGRTPWGSNARLIAKGWYRDWPDRNAAAGILRESSQGDLRVEWRTQGVHCRPGTDCERPAAIPQYYQRNYYQIDHWNDCGPQVHMEGEVKVDAVNADTRACTNSVDAITGVITPLVGQWSWLFGLIKAVCG